ncbi:hypothetical protein Droror1_Dr00023408 [Drosera rotundifolia]
MNSNRRKILSVARFWALSSVALFTENWAFLAQEGNRPQLGIVWLLGEYGPTPLLGSRSLLNESKGRDSKGKPNKINVVVIYPKLEKHALAFKKLYFDATQWRNCESLGHSG